MFDLETTGVDVDTSRIVSACIAVLDDTGAVVARWDWLADPGIEIPAGTAHQARNEGGTDVKFLVISSPPAQGDRREADSDA